MFRHFRHTLSIEHYRFRIIQILWFAQLFQMYQISGTIISKQLHGCSTYSEWVFLPISNPIAWFSSESINQFDSVLERNRSYSHLKIFAHSLKHLRYDTRLTFYDVRSEACSPQTHNSFFYLLVYFCNILNFNEPSLLSCIRKMSAAYAKHKTKDPCQRRIFTWMYLMDGYVQHGSESEWWKVEVDIMNIYWKFSLGQWKCWLSN